MKLPALVFLLLFPIWVLCWHTILSRFTRHRWPRQKTATYASLSGVMVCSFVIFAFERRFDLALLAFTLINGLSIGHVYFHFFNMGETARRIRLLTELATKQTLTDGGYDETQMIRTRLQRLIDLRQIDFDGFRYSTKPTLLRWTARGITVYREILLSRGR